jgi:hypothetical protein
MDRKNYYICKTKYEKWMVVVMQNDKEKVGICDAAKFLEVSVNTLRNNEVITEDGKRYLVYGNCRIRVYLTPGGGCRRYMKSDLEILKYL